MTCVTFHSVTTNPLVDNAFFQESKKKTFEAFNFPHEARRRFLRVDYVERMATGGLFHQI